VRVYTPVGKTAEGELALRVGVATLDHLSDYFGHVFPLPKQDMVCLRDFSSGAMENWGLVTYRESMFLGQVGVSSDEHVLTVASTVAHELAHQWFGNLVSPRWWTQLWLNEGFATIVSAVAVDELYPELRYTRNYVLCIELQQALTLDALVTTHPVEVVVKDVAEVEQIFDAISYSKGAAVLAMLFDRLGRETMREGLRAYLGRHAYGNAVTGDLWQALSVAARIDVGAEMGRWVSTPGYPMVKLSWVEERKTLVVQQQRFFSDPAAYKEDGIGEADDGLAWRFALHLTMGGGVRHSVHVTERRQEFVLPSRPLAANDGCTLLARVLYDEETLPLYASPQDIASLSPETKIALVSDAFALAAAGRQSAAAPLSLSLSLAGETEFCIARLLLSRLHNLFGAMVADDDEAARSAAATVVRRVASPMLEAHGWTRRPDDEAGADDVRGMAIVALGTTVGEAEVVSKCRSILTSWVGGEVGVASNAVLGACVAVVAYTATDEASLTLLRTGFRAAKTNEVQELFLNSMTQCSHATLAEAQLRWVLSSGEVRPNMMRNPIMAFVRRNAGRSLVLPVLTAIWPLVVERFATAAHDASVLISQSSQCLSTQEDVDALLALAGRFPKPETIARAVAQAKEKGEQRVRMVDAGRAEVLAFLATVEGGEAATSPRAKRARR
jgi:aminopeptidase 2